MGSTDILAGPTLDFYNISVLTVFAPDIDDISP